MKFRLTIKEIESKSDLELLRILVVERRSTLNIYSTLNKRLGEIENKLQNIINYNDDKERFDLKNLEVQE